MACFRPVQAWQLDGGEIVFKERGRIRRSLTLPCGRCAGCLASRARSWAIRCMHEAQMHKVNAFVTLTYRPPCDPSLNFRDFTLFMKRFRRALGPVRFYGCGEYGSKDFRPHFHVLMFGWYPDRDTYPVGKDLVASKELERIWPHGFNSVGQVTYQSAGYVARYCMKKAFVDRETALRRLDRIDPGTGEVYRVEPEGARMSKGIGRSWFDKYWRDVYAARDGVVLAGGRTVKAPRYYDKLLAASDNWDLKDQKDLERYIKSAQFSDDCTPERLATREFVALANERSRRSL